MLEDRDGLAMLATLSQPAQMNELLGVMTASVYPLPEVVDSTWDRSSLWKIDLPAKNLPLLAGTKRYEGPGLVFDTSEGGNVFRFMHSNMEGGRYVTAYLVPYWVCGLPVLGVHAAHHYPAGTELVYDWGDESFELLQRHDLVQQASASHAMHRYVGLINQQCQKVGVANVSMFDTKMPRLVRMRFDSEHLVYQFAGHPTKIAFAPTTSRQKLESSTQRQISSLETDCPVVPTDQVFSDTGCTYVWQVGVSGDAYKVLTRIREQGGVLPPHWEDWASGERLEQCRELLLGGKLPSGVEVRQIITLEHPARWFAPPDQPQYGVWASSDLTKNRIICTYAGTLITAEELDKQHDQVYGLDLGDVFEYLHVDASSTGSLGRFVNGALPPTIANAAYQVRWDRNTGLPVVFLVATRNINTGEEILVDYGDTYWPEVYKRLTNAHAEYWLRGFLYARCQAIELRKKGVQIVDVPTWDDSLLESSRGLLWKPLPFLREIFPRFHHLETAISPEIVLARKNQTFLVKWVGCDWSWNTWEPEAVVPHSLIDAFEFTPHKRDLIRRMALGEKIMHPHRRKHELYVTKRGSSVLKKNYDTEEEEEEVDELLAPNCQTGQTNDKKRKGHKKKEKDGKDKRRRVEETT